MLVSSGFKRRTGILPVSILFAVGWKKLETGKMPVLRLSVAVVKNFAAGLKRPLLGSGG